MTALSAERNTLQYGTTVIPDFLQFGVAAAQNCWEGGLAALNGSGYVQPPQTAGSLFCVGVHYIDANNTAGANGAINAKIKQGVFAFAQGAGADAITIANVGSNCYAIDDQTVGLTNGYAQTGTVRPIAGRIVYVDASGNVYVLVGLTGWNDLPQINTPVLVHTARAVTTSALPAYTAAGGVLTANANGALTSVFDGVTVAVGDVIFLPAGIAATASDEGPYVVTSLGGASAKWTMQRPLDWQTGTVFQNGSIFEIREGTLFVGSSWKSFSTGAGTVDTTAPLFYPREVTQQVTLVAGTATIANVPIRSASKTNIIVARVTANTTTATIMYAPIGGLTAGALGTATFNIQAAVAAGTINNADISTLNVSVVNW